MKRLLGLTLLALSMSGFSQSSVNRPGLGNPNLRDGSGKDMTASSVIGGQIMEFVLPVYNNSFDAVVKAGSGMLEVDLGKEGGPLELVSLPVSSNFSWEKPVNRDGHMYIIGRLIRDLSASYVGNESLFLRSSVTLNTRIRVHWVDRIPSSDKHSEIYAELQIQVVSRR